MRQIWSTCGSAHCSCSTSRDIPTLRRSFFEPTVKLSRTETSVLYIGLGTLTKIFMEVMLVFLS